MAAAKSAEVVALDMRVAQLEAVVASLSSTLDMIPGARIARVEQARLARLEKLRAIPPLAPAERAAALAALSHVERTELLSQAGVPGCIEILAGLDRKTCDGLIADMPAQIAIIVKVQLLPATPRISVKLGVGVSLVRTEFTLLGVEDVDALRAVGLGGLVRVDAHNNHRLDGLTLDREQPHRTDAWIVRLKIDRSLAAAVANGSLVVEALPDEASRSIDIYEGR